MSLVPRASALLVGALACAPPPSTTSSSAPSGDAPAQTGDDLSNAPLGQGAEGTCALDKDAFAAIAQPEPGAVGSVVRVEWQAPAARHTWVRFADSLGIEREVAADADGGVTLRGLLPDTDVTYRLVAEIDGVLWCDDLRTAHTTALPVGMPELALTLGDSGAVSDAFLALPILTAERRFAAVVDTAGQLVWAWELPDDVATNSAAYRVDFSLDGESILVNAQAAPGQPGAIWRVPWDGNGIHEMLIDNIHRDFAELPDGTLAFLGWESRELADGSLLRGDVVFERSPDGTQRVAWNMWEHFDHGLGPSVPLDMIDAPGVAEWAHANGLTWDQSTDSYLISLPEFGDPSAPAPLGSLISVDRATGETNWELSNTRGDFAAASPDVMLEAPHSVQLVDGGLLTFNRGTPDSCSRATEIALDFESGEAWVDWESRSDRCIHVVFLGDAIRLDDGNTVVMYSSAGQLDIVDQQGRPLWSLQSDLGAAFGFVDHRSRLYGAPLSSH